MADRRQQPAAGSSQRGKAGKRRSSEKGQRPARTPIHPPQHAPQSTASPPIPQDTFQLPALPAQSQGSAQSQTGPPPKVAIPRIPRESDDGPQMSPARGGDKHRVGHACEPCRHRKTKCSGERPACKHCQDFKIPCVYADGKRDRARKEFGTMSGRLEVYEALLNDLQSRVDAADHLAIQMALEKDTATVDEDIFSTQGPKKHQTSPTDRDELDETADGESVVSAGVGSVGSLDRTHEDFNRNETVRATGYLGKNSEAAWMQSLRLQADYGSSRGSETDTDMADNAKKNDEAQTSSLSVRPALSGRRVSSSRHEVSLYEVNYQCDDMDVTISDEVDPFELPPREVADALFAQYLNSVHTSFPILRKVYFISQYNNYLNRVHTPDPLKPGNKWLAILNLVFAISAKYSHLIQADWRGDERDHLIFFNRARLLGMSSNSLLDHPDLQQVQITGLAGFYLLCTNQINRAWNFVGVALRYGISLALNLRNDDKGIQDISKEIRFRVWWSLYSIERLLCVMTGRPSAIEDSNCTAPMPVPVEEGSFVNANLKLYQNDASKIRRFNSSDQNPDEIFLSAVSSRSASQLKSSVNSPGSASPSSSSQQGSMDWTKSVPPNNALFFLNHTQLSMLSHDVLCILYSPMSKKGSWEHVQQDISRLDERREAWRLGLPGLFDFKKDQRDQQFARERMSLAMFHYSVKILIHRPTLCRIDRRIPHESRGSKEFNRNAAASCVHAARDMLALLPHHPNAVGMYKIAPWWCVVHYLAQAIVVLLLEVSFRSDHVPVEAEGILETAKKGIFWLNRMSEESVAARRSWHLCSDMLHKVAPKIGGRTDEMPIDAPRSKEDPNPNVMSLHPQHFEVSWSPDTWSQPFAEQSYFGGPQHNSDAFHAHMYTPYDQFFPYDVSASQAEHVSSMFPSSTQMQTMGEEELWRHESLPNWPGDNEPSNLPPAFEQFQPEPPPPPGSE
ncbi:MAG: hypothetical protein M1836_007924 [Candelina mexicana]|nr:MAG: hypothetical protein M1836_007924 [Candelina mexicana]